MEKVEQPKSFVINLPKQKTITALTSKSLDAKANKWLEVRAKNKENPPQLGKAGQKFPFYFATYYWFDKVEIKETAEGS